jgi:hypothetical protein
MSRSTGAKVTVLSYNKSSTNQKWTLRAPTWLQKLHDISMFGQVRASSSTRSLPRHNVHDQCSSSTSSMPAPNAVAPSKPTLHLLACTHRTQRRKCLLQDPIDCVATDRALFCFMKQQLRRSRSRIRSLLSMRSVQGMFFVKVGMSPSDVSCRADDVKSSACGWATRSRFETTIHVARPQVQTNANAYPRC